MFRCSLSRHAWWNYVTERKVRYAMMYGGSFVKKATNSYHKVYIRKFKRNAFPNRRRVHWNVSMTGVARQRPRRVPWPYDITSMIFNQSRLGSDKIGYVVGTKMMKTAVVAASYLVFYPKYNQRVARVGRYFAHDEDLACVDGDLVHIKLCRKISRYKHYYVFSILEPNIEGRERLKLGLRAVSPHLFGYPHQRRIVKLNLTAPVHAKQVLASSIQEQVQDFYRYSGTPSEKAAPEALQVTFDEANKMIAPNASMPAVPGSKSALLPDGFVGMPLDARDKKGDDFWMKQQPTEKYDVKNLTKSP